MELKKKLQETDHALLELAITEMRQRFSLESKDIISCRFELNLGAGLQGHRSQGRRQKTAN